MTSDQIKISLGTGLGWFLGKALYPSVTPFQERLINGASEALLIAILSLVLSYFIIKIRQKSE